MTFVDRHLTAIRDSDDADSGPRQRVRDAVVIVVEDRPDLSGAFRAVCECLDIAVEPVPSHADLETVLRRHRPMAVVAQMEAAGQDGCHVLMTVANYDCDLPVLLLVGNDGALLGAVDAVEELWGLSSVLKWPRLLGVGAIVDFLFRAGRRSGSLGLMPL